MVHAAVVKRCSLKCRMARRCSETHILLLLDERSRRIRWVDGTKLWRNAKRSFWKLCSMKFGGSSHENVRFGSLFCEISRKPRTKRSFWKLCSVKYGGSLARNVRFGSLFYEISRKHRTKHFFWKLCTMKFGGSLARNVLFGSLFFEISRKYRTKRSFWKLFL